MKKLGAFAGAAAEDKQRRSQSHVMDGPGCQKHGHAWQQPAHGRRVQAMRAVAVGKHLDLGSIVRDRHSIFDFMGSNVALDGYDKAHELHQKVWSADQSHDRSFVNLLCWHHVNANPLTTQTAVAVSYFNELLYWKWHWCIASTSLESY